MTPWTVACQALLPMGFSRQEYWSGLPFPSPGDLPNPGIEPGSPALQEVSLPSEPPRKPCSLSFLQGIFPTQGWNPGLQHFRHVLYQLSYQGSPRILEWVDCPFSRGTSQPGCHFLDLPLLPGCHFLIARVFQIIILRGGVKG